jgi:hypothetical protein
MGCASALLLRIALTSRSFLSVTLLAYLLRGYRPVLWFCVAGTRLFALGLAVCLSWIAPAILASWQRGSVPDFDAVRLRWGVGHLVIAGIKLLAFLAIALAILTVRFVTSKTCLYASGSAPFFTTDDRSLNCR